MRTPLSAICADISERFRKWFFYPSSYTMPLSQNVVAKMNDILQAKPLPRLPYENWSDLLVVAEHKENGELHLYRDFVRYDTKNNIWLEDKTFRPVGHKFTHWILAQDQDTLPL